MKICVIGGGPCGTYISYMLGSQGHSVELYECQSYLGGCWHNTKVDSKYFSEHSPRIMFNNYYNTINFMHEIGIEFNQEFKKVFGTFSKSFRLLKEFTYSDLFSLTKAYLLPLSSFKNYKVSDLVEYYKISKNGAEQLNELCYTIDGVSMYTMTATEFLETMDKTMLYSGYEAKTNSDTYLIPKLEKALSEVGVHVHCNCELKHVHGTNVKIYNTITEKHINLQYDKIIVCIPPIDFGKVLQYSSKDIKYNWGKISNKNSYTGFGIQYHFKKDISKYYKHSDILGDWKIIATYNKSSKCISCVVLEFNLKSSFTNKTLNECSKHEIINEVWRIIKCNVLVELYDHVTISPGITKTYEGYKCPHNAFIRNNNYIDYQGFKDLNVYYVGPHNKTYMPFTSYESAIQSAKIFLKKSKLYSKFLYVYSPLSFKSVMLFFIFFIILIFIFIRN